MNAQLSPSEIIVPSMPGEAVMSFGAEPVGPAAGTASNTKFGVGITFDVGTTPKKSITLMADDVTGWLAGNLTFVLYEPIDLPTVKDLVGWAATQFSFSQPDWTAEPFKTIGDTSLRINAFEIAIDNKVLKKLLLDMKVNTTITPPGIPMTITGLMFRIEYQPAS